jgi:hypothetical protein
MPAIRNVGSVAGIVLALWLSIPIQLSARIVGPQSTFDLVPLISRAPIIFRGSVVEVSAVPEPGESFSRWEVARFQVDRRYRDPEGSSDSVRVGAFGFIAGHNCIHFEPGTHWLIFARDLNGHLEAIDDCFGAVEVSRFLGPALESNDVTAQMEADFIAGLNDPDPAARLLSIQRLGGLRSPSSQPALHRMMESPHPAEAKWATYAALRTGDYSVLPKVRELLLNKDSEVSSHWLAFEFTLLKDTDAIHGLIEMAAGAPDPRTRMYARTALRRTVRTSESLLRVASHLSDPDAGVRFTALVRMQAITHESDCTLSRYSEYSEDMIETRIGRCLEWWGRVSEPSFSSRPE